MKKERYAPKPITDRSNPKAIVRHVYERFAFNIPRDAMSAGLYEPPDKGDKNAKKYGVPDGRYRVAGADWIVEFKGGYLDSIFRAVAPDFGGPDVIHVPADPNIHPANGGGPASERSNG